MGDLTWSLSDPSLDLLGRTGVGAIALALDAARELERDLSPLVGRYDATDLSLSWPEDVPDQDALTRLVEWVWQTRNAQEGDEGLGVLYFPGIHPRPLRDDPTSRLVEHSGVLSTFLQHPRVQPKTKPKTTESRIDDRIVRHRYVEPTKQVAYVRDFDKFFKRRQQRRDPVKLKYVRPGGTARHHGEVSWAGTIHQGLPLICAPTACFYLQIRGAVWIVVAPDPVDLRQFVHRRRVIRLSARETIAASATDAAFRVLLAMRTQTVARQLEQRRDIVQECRVMRVGKVAWNRLSVRSRALRLRPSEELLDAFERVERHLGNRLKERSTDETAFVTVPSPRGVITENLAAGTYWYRDLLEVPRELREQVENNRRTGESAQRAWFRWTRLYRRELSSLMTELQELDDEARAIDAIFRDAFHEALRCLYGREAKMAKRGTRDVADRHNDRAEKIRRDLTKAQTRAHLREALAALFAEAGRRFIDDPHDWRRARDLALLSLATYGGNNADEDAEQGEEGREEG